MAWFRTGGGGGALSETVLWTNPSPTTGISETTTVDLSESLDNFTYIGMYCRFSNSDTTESFAMMKTEDLATASTSLLKGQYLTVCTRRASSGTGQVIARVLYGSSNKSKVSIGNCYALTSTTAATYSSNMIPTKIVGLK